MGLFKPAKNESAFLKMGLMGNAGSGKTLTATLTAIGLIKLCRERGFEYAKRPVFFLDSENGSDYVQDLFEEAGIELMVHKSKAFSDLCEAMIEAEKSSSFFVVDSVSAYWEEWKKSYAKTKKRTRLQFDDHNEIKEKWREGFTDRFISSKLHIIMCGRLGYEWDYSVDEDTGKKNLEKTDVKMVAEKELGYESSLYILMERDRNMKDMGVVRTATILKDRFRAIDGQTFENPTFKTFSPHILKLNLGGEHRGIDLTRTSAGMVAPDARRDNYQLRRKIQVEYIDALLAEHGMAGQTAEAKKKRLDAVKKHFLTTSRSEIEELMPLDDLRAGYASLHLELTGKPPTDGGPPAKAEPEIKTDAQLADGTPLVDDEIPFEKPAEKAVPNAPAEPIDDRARAPAQPDKQPDTPAANTPAIAAESAVKTGQTTGQQPDIQPDTEVDELDEEEALAAKVTGALAGYQANMDMSHSPTRINQVHRNYASVVSEFSKETQAKFDKIKSEALARVKAATAAA